MHIRTFAAESTSYKLYDTFPNDASVVDKESASYRLTDDGMNWHNAALKGTNYQMVSPLSVLNVGATGGSGGTGTTGGGGSSGDSATSGTSGTTGGGSGSGKPRPAVSNSPSKPTSANPAPSKSPSKPAAPSTRQPSTPAAAQKPTVAPATTKSEVRGPTLKAQVVKPTSKDIYKTRKALPPIRRRVAYLAGNLLDHDATIVAAEAGIAVRLAFIYRTTAALEMLPAFASAEASLLSLGGATAGMGASGAVLAPLAALHRRRRHWWGDSSSVDA